MNGTDRNKSKVVNNVGFVLPEHGLLIKQANYDVTLTKPEYIRMEIHGIT